MSRVPESLRHVLSISLGSDVPDILACQDLFVLRTDVIGGTLQAGDKAGKSHA